MRGKLIRALRVALPGLAVCVGASAFPHMLPWSGSSGASLAHAQSYEGVAPGSSVVPEGIAAKPGGTALVTWPGFQMLPSGASRVFIQLTVEVKPELKQVGSGWQLVLPSVSLPPGNARRPLDTSFFNTPVTTLRSKKHKDDVIVQLDMRAKVSPTLRTEKAATGYFFVYLEFPVGNFKSGNAK
jgi:hypothetical protein